MKRIFFYLITSLTILLLSNCEKRQDAEVVSPVENRTVHISFTTDQGSKSQIIDNSGAFSFNWAENDKIYVYDGTRFCGSLSIDPESIGKPVAKFDGDIIVPSGEDIVFIHLGADIGQPVDGQETIVDFFSQDGTLNGMASKLVAACQGKYKPGTSVYSGNLVVQFAVGKFNFSGAGYGANEKIAVRGVKRTIVISETGAISFGSPEENSSEITCDDLTQCYVLFPVTDGYDCVTFLRTDQTAGNRYYDYSFKLKGGFFYSAKGGGAVLVPELPSHNCTIEYKNGTELFESVNAGTSATSQVIDNEPVWPSPTSKAPTYKRFLGWSKTDGDTKAVYSKPGSALTDTHTVSTIGYENIKLYAVWSAVLPWIDFESTQSPSMTGVSFSRSTSDWSFNAYQKYTFKGNTTATTGYTRFSIPIYNLTKDEWYVLYFSESLSQNGSGNWWNESFGSYATAVRSAIPAANTDYDSDNTVVWSQTTPTQEQTISPDLFAWTLCENCWSTQGYEPMTNGKIIFKATASTMYWLWDVSKQNNSNTYDLTVTAKSLQELDLSSSTPVVDFVGTSLYGFRFEGYTPNDPKRAGQESGKTYSSWGLGRCYGTYKLYAENNNKLVLYNVGYPKRRGIVNVPIRNLQVGTTYKLTFTCKRVPEETGTNNDLVAKGFGDDATYQGGSYHYAFKDNLYTDTRIDTEDNIVSDGFSALPRTTEFTQTYTFTATASTMYWVWSIGACRVEYRFVHRITNVSLAVDTQCDAQASIRIDTAEF